MRKSRVICVLMISLLLTACGQKGSGTPMDRALAARGVYLSASGCTARMRVTADYGQRVYTYVVDAVVRGEETTLTVLEPAELAGITAHLQGGDGMLSYDGAMLETGPLAEDGLTPISAIAALLEGVRHGFIDSCGTQGDGLYILCRDPAEEPGKGRELGLWLGEDHRLLRGEVSVDGRRVVQCEFTEFALN